MFQSRFRKRFVLRSPLSREECVSRLHDSIERDNSRFFSRVWGYVNQDELSLQWRTINPYNNTPTVFLSAKFSSDGDQTQLDCISGCSLFGVVMELIWFVAFLGLAYAAASLSVDYWVHGYAHAAQQFGEFALAILLLGIFALFVLPFLAVKRWENILLAFVESAIAEPVESEPSREVIPNYRYNQKHPVAAVFIALGAFFSIPLAILTIKQVMMLIR